MYTLYGRSGSGNAAIEALLEEMEVPYRLEMVEKRADGRLADELQTLNPLGQVPVLVLPSGAAMTESCAIMIYLADLHSPGQLAPLPASEHRPAFLRWMVFLAANPYMTDLRLYYSSRYTTDPNGTEGVRKAASRDMAREFVILAEGIGSGPWLLGETFSAVDVYAAMIATWAEDVPDMFQRHPEIAHHFARVRSRPKVSPVWERHGWTF
jgi:glutathione S-transferase